MNIARLKTNEPMSEEDARQAAGALRRLADLIEKRTPSSVELHTDREVVEQPTNQAWTGDFSSRLSDVNIGIKW